MELSPTSISRAERPYGWRAFGRDSFSEPFLEDLSPLLYSHFLLVLIFILILILLLHLHLHRPPHPPQVASTRMKAGFLMMGRKPVQVQEKDEDEEKDKEYAKAEEKQAEIDDEREEGGIDGLNINEHIMGTTTTYHFFCFV